MTTTRGEPAINAQTTTVQPRDFFEAVGMARDIRNHSQYIRIARIYMRGERNDPEFRILAFNGNQGYAVGYHVASFGWDPESRVITMSWGWGHYFNQAGEALDEVDGMACIWDRAFDGEVA